MESTIREVTFDQRIEQIGISTPRGFTIYEYERGLILYDAKFEHGGSEHIALLSDSNLVAASGDGSDQGYSRSTVILWNTDKHQNKVVRQIEHESPVLKIFFTADVLVVVQQNAISFYNTANFQEYNKIPKCAHNSDICSLVQTTSLSLMTVPSEDGQCLHVVDFHEPTYPLSSIKTPVSDISFVSFSRHGSLLAVAIDGGKNINLWSVKQNKIIAKYKRGTFSTKVSGIMFDNLSHYFLMTSKRGTLHVFQVPSQYDPKLPSMRSKYSLDIKKESEFICQFDAAGYIITCVTSSGLFKKMRLDIEKECIVSIDKDKRLDL